MKSDRNAVTTYSGFALVEMAIVLVIVALIAAGPVGLDAKSNVGNILPQASEAGAAKSGAVESSAADAAYPAARWPNASPQAFAVALQHLCGDTETGQA